MSCHAVTKPVPPWLAVTVALLLSAASAGVAWHARAASEPFTIPLADDGAAAAPAAVAQVRSDSAPPPPLFMEPQGAQPGAGPAGEETTAPEAVPGTAAPEAEAATAEPPASAAPAAGAPVGETPVDETEPQAASRGDGDVEALLRQLMADDSVVAIVDGKAILWGEVWSAVDELPGDYRSQPEVLFPALLRRAVDMILLANAARREELHKDPALRRQVAAYEERLLRERVLQRHLEAAVTDDKLEALYAQHIQRLAGAVEVTASHIQLDSEAAALAVIAALDQGADFATLAHERSLAASAKQGGSLGSFRLDRMPPGFGAAVARLVPGEYSREPARSEFGWHVIKLERRSGAALPSFAELEPDLRQEAERAAINDLLQDLRQRASIEIMPAAAGEQTPE